MSITFKPQFEKRVLIPLTQAGWITLGVGTVSILVIDVTAPETEKILQKCALAGLSAGVLWMVRQFEVANHPRQAPRLAPAPAFDHNVAWLDPLDKEEGKPSVAEGWPVDLDRLKFFCWQVGYRSAPLTMDHWTYNSSRGSSETKIFLKREFGSLIGKMKARDMVVKINPNNKHSGVCMTEKGIVWCRMVVSKRTPPSLDSFEQLVATGFFRGVCMQEDMHTPNKSGGVVA